MFPNELNALLDDEFLAVLGCVSSNRAVANALRNSKRIRAVTESLAIGKLDETHIRGFVSSLLHQFRTGELFPWDLTLAALAVSLERRQSVFVDEFLTDLSRVGLAEFPMSPRIARDMLTQRSSLPRLKSRLMVLSSSKAPSGWNLLPVAPRQNEVGQTQLSINLGAA